MGRYVRSTFVEDQRDFVERLQIGKQIGKLLDMPKRPQAQKNIFLGLEYEKSGNLVPNLEKFEIFHKDVHTNAVQNGCDAFPNELMRFRFKAKPIWDKIQKHCKMQSSFKSGSDLLCRK